MRFLVTAIFLALMLSTGAAHAGQAEVRDVALSNNCTPKKTEIYQQSLGGGGEIIYRVQCTVPKTVGAAADTGTKPPDALLISCKQSLCEVLRAVTLESK